MPKRPAMRRSEPPPERTSPYDWEYIAKRLMKDPGEWREIYKRDRATYANALGRGKITALRPQFGFEFRTANNTREDADTPRLCDLWARYCPEKDERN